MKKILLFICILFLLVGCGKEKATKVSKEISDFERACRDSGYTASNNMGAYTSDKYITNASICRIDENDGIKYDMEMVVYDNESSAIKVQDNQIEQIKMLKSINGTQSDDEGENYRKYTMISNGYYMVSSRIDNTLIFTKIFLDEKDNVDVIFNILGY